MIEIKKMFCGLLVCGGLSLLFSAVAVADGDRDMPASQGVAKFRTIRSVERVKGRLMVNWSGHIAPMTKNYSLNYCGAEISPTIENIKSLEGKPCVAVIQETDEGLKVRRFECSCPQ